MIIRPETAADYVAIRNILIAAFANHPYSHQTEHLIVEALREAKALTVGLVAVDENAAIEQPSLPGTLWVPLPKSERTKDSPSPPAPLPQAGEGKVVGHIAFSLAKINGKDCGWYILGPVAVEPKRQRQGIGQALVREGIEQLRNLGAQGCVLVGDPAYYGRFGFQNHPSLTLKGVPPEVFLCLPMTDHIPQGEVIHHAAFSAGQ
jgi:putative acetyltransferase